MKYRNYVMTGVVTVSLLMFITSCGDDNDSLQDLISGGGSTEPDKIEAVDLGLSVKWATCNIGASSPEKFGGYYAWGETEEKESYSWDNYKYWTDNNGDGKYYIYDEDGDLRVDESELTDIGENISGTEYDVARVKWGDNWRMPTQGEKGELVRKCTWTWGDYNGVNGWHITGPNGNSIFLPAAGYRTEELISAGTQSGTDYWTATRHGVYKYVAYYLYNGVTSLYSPRFYGHPVRAVTE
ncbi:MAG: hypothetical protein IJY36_00810 [Coprobacter sp.]|nr:hypothetical protein [Coprobacter sp.]